MNPQDSAFGGHYSGLTKREYIAVLLLQPLLAEAVSKDTTQIDFSICRALYITDELIKELNKNEK
jgi:hypothetical protein